MYTCTLLLEIISFPVPTLCASTAEEFQDSCLLCQTTAGARSQARSCCSGMLCVVHTHTSYVELVGGRLPQELTISFLGYTCTVYRSPAAFYLWCTNMDVHCVWFLRTAWSCEQCLVCIVVRLKFLLWMLFTAFCLPFTICIENGTYMYVVCKLHIYISMNVYVQLAHYRYFFVCMMIDFSDNMISIPLPFLFVDRLVRSFRLVIRIQPTLTSSSTTSTIRSLSVGPHTSPSTGNTHKSIHRQQFLISYVHLHYTQTFSTCLLLKHTTLSSQVISVI